MKIKKYTNGAWTDLDKPVKKYDTYTDETTTLPLTIEASTTDAIENYQVYGTSEGAGVETENLFVEGEYSLDGHYLKSDGSTENNQYWSISEYISVSPDTKYTMYNCAETTPGFCWYDANKNYISGDTFNNRSAVTVTSPATAKYVRLSVCTTTYAYGTKNSDVFKLVIGSAYPSYKIPILCQSEIVTENLFDKNATDTNNGYVDGYHLKNDGTTGSNSSWAISEYMPITGGLNYTFNYGTLSSSPAICYYDSGRHYIGGVPYGGQNPKVVSVPQNTSYIRFSFMKSYADDIMFVQGDSLPDHYIPHFYQSNYDLFIGDTKLYEDEYLDFSEQKVYKRTENLHNVQTDLLDYRITWATGALIQSQGSSISDYIPVIEGQTYSVNRILIWLGYDSQQTYLGAWYSSANKFIKDGNTSPIVTLTIPNGCQYIRLLGIGSYMDNIALVHSDTPPKTYIPYLQPTDPPVPLPAISAYKGENNLSVDTTVQPEKVAVEYEGWKGVGDVEKYQNGEWSDNNGT